MEHDRIIEAIELQMSELDGQMARTRLNILKILADTRDLNRNIHKLQAQDMCQTHKKTIKDITQIYKVTTNRD